MAFSVRVDGVSVFNGTAIGRTLVVLLPKNVTATKVRVVLIGGAGGNGGGQGGKGGGGQGGGRKRSGSGGNKNIQGSASAPRESYAASGGRNDDSSSSLDTGYGAPLGGYQGRRRNARELNPEETNSAYEEYEY